MTKSARVSWKALDISFSNSTSAREPGGAAADDRVAEEREARVAAPDLVLELVDPLLEIAQAHGVGRAVHRLIGGGLAFMSTLTAGGGVGAGGAVAGAALAEADAQRRKRTRRPRPTQTPWSPSASRSVRAATSE